MIHEKNEQNMTQNPRLCYVHFIYDGVYDFLSRSSPYLQLVRTVLTTGTYR